jgi:tripartite-type tricarboxylate transporter receptor subunit TctC
VLALGLSPVVAFAQQSYPNRPVTIVVPYAAGGGIDQLARLLALKLEKRLGKPFVIENRTGSATAIGAAYVSRAPADGHTILLATSTTMAINVSVYKSLAYDPTRDLAPVALIMSSPFILVVNPSLPVHSVPELIKLAKEKPLNYGSSGNGSFHHLNAELLQSLSGIRMTHVPYRATTLALNDVIAGHVHLMFGDVTSTLPQVREGKVRALGVSTAKRIAPAPDIPPLAEAGLPGFEGSSWQMVVAPAQTPKEIVDRLNTEFRAVMDEPDVKQELSRRGTVPLLTPPAAELPAFVKAEIARWGELVQRAGIAGTE